MSWKNGIEPASQPTDSQKAARPTSGGSRVPSLAARLTAWYAASAFALVLAASGVLYIALERSLDADNDRILADRIADVRNVLKNHADARRELADEVDESASPRQHTPVYYRILDAAGAAIAESPGMTEDLARHVFPQPIAVENKSTTGMEIRAASGRRYRALSALAPFPSRISPRPAEGPVNIQIALSLAPQEKLLAAYRKRLWVAMSAALIACVVIGYEIARRGIRPIENVTRIARRIRSTTLDARIDATPMPAELQSLAGEFNEMMDRLQESFLRINRFSADIAHELRTPVNNLRGTAEVALQKGRSREEYRDALISCIEDCVRLTHIIESLLFLARAEDPMHQIQREPIDVARELQSVAEFYEASASEAGVSIDVKPNSGPIPANLNRTLFQRAVGNLLSNSIAHTPTGGHITVAAKRENGSLHIEVADTGRGIPAEHVGRVFDRLYRVADDRSKNTGGTGLGLAIVKSIAASHGGTVSLSSKVGEGTRVTISVPTNDLPDGNHS